MIEWLEAQSDDLHLFFDYFSPEAFALMSELEVSPSSPPPRSFFSPLALFPLRYLLPFL